MLGLHQFAGPHFQIPQIPADERALHKIKDFASFLNSLQWEADDEPEQDEWGEGTRDVKFDMNNGRDDRRGAEAAAAGLDASLNSGHDVSRRVGSTRWDGMDDSQLWEQAINSMVTGENPITRAYGDKVGMTPNDVDYFIYDEDESNKMAPEKRWVGYDPFHKAQAIRDSVPGIDPNLMTRVGENETLKFDQSRMPKSIRDSVPGIDPYLMTRVGENEKLKLDWGL